MLLVKKNIENKSSSVRRAKQNRFIYQIALFAVRKNQEASGSEFHEAIFH